MQMVRVTFEARDHLAVADFPWRAPAKTGLSLERELLEYMRQLPSFVRGRHLLD